MTGEQPLPAAAGLVARSASERRPPPHNVAGWLRACGSLAVLAGFAYLLLLAWVYHHQERLIFRPAPLAATHRFDLADVHELSIPVAGATLSALHLRLPNPRGLIFFLHGNSGNAADWLSSTDFYRAANYDLLLLDYRGYGKSGGRIESEEQLRADVRTAWQAIAPAYAGRRTVIYGRSLGTALAAGLAAEVRPDLTILVSPYCSMRQLMRQHHPLLPPALLRYPLATCADAARIDGPLLLVHGDSDTLIPIAHSEELAATVPHAKLLRLAGAAHADVHRFPAYGAELMRALQALPPTVMTLGHP